MDDLDAATCPNDGTALRDEHGALVCGGCGYRIEPPDIDMPSAFDGPTLNG